MDDDRRIASTIDTLLGTRAASTSICPSEVARALADDEAAWRALMPAVQRVAAEMAAAGRLRVTRGDVEVDAMSAGGPIRLRRPR